MIKTIIWGDASHDGHGYTEVATVELINITWEEVMEYYVAEIKKSKISLLSRTSLTFYTAIDLQTLADVEYFFCGYGEDNISLDFLEKYCRVFFSDEDMEYLREHNEEIPYYELVEYELDVFDLFLAQVSPQIPDTKSIRRIDNSESIVHLSIGYGVLYD